jgi:hypothetical protein
MKGLGTQVVERLPSKQEVWVQTLVLSKGKKERTIDTCYNTDEQQKHYAKLRKPVTKTIYCMVTYMKYLGQANSQVTESRHVCQQLGKCNGCRVSSCWKVLELDTRDGLHPGDTKTTESHVEKDKLFWYVNCMSQQKSVRRVINKSIISFR